MWRFNLRERWKARTYTPFSLFPQLWIIIIALNVIGGADPFHFFHYSVVGPGEYVISSDTKLPLLVALLQPLTPIAGSIMAFRRRRPRRWRAVGWGWTWKWRFLRRFDGRFHLFPFGPLKKLRLTEAAYGDFNGAACASFSVWPRWQLLRRFYDIDLVELPAELPGLALFPMGQYDRAAAALGGADIETESDAFNREWRVVAHDERYALAVLHPLMIEELLKPAYRNLPVTIDGGAILTWHPGRARFTELGARLAALRNLAALIPRHVWDDFGELRLEAWGSPGTLRRPGWQSLPVNPVTAFKQLQRVGYGSGLAGVVWGFGVGTGAGVPPPGSVNPTNPDDLDAGPPVDTSPTWYPEGDNSRR